MRTSRTAGDSAAGRVEVVVIEEGTAGGGDAAGDVARSRGPVKAPGKPKK